jgi:hypothetical protein
MKAERWKRIDDLLQATLQLPAEKQHEFLRWRYWCSPGKLFKVYQLQSSG